MPRVRFERDERVQLQPLAARGYTSLVLDAPPPTPQPRRASRPVVPVEKRALTVYAQLTNGVA